jgi:hypothetical protein
MSKWSSDNVRQLQCETEPELSIVGLPGSDDALIKGLTQTWHSQAGSVLRHLSAEYSH